MSNLQIFLWVLLLICFTSYVICGLLVISNYKIIQRADSGGIYPSDTYKKKEFLRSMQANSSGMLRLQGWLLICATIIFALFDSQYYVVASMFTVLLAIAHFDFSARII
ncbi:MAG TPA: hypothetical protein DCS23_03750 [Candidatus Yonathbacteria bacterium]|nr:hypothetical protein [Candidatus Yonathbacteria bacterium]